MNGASCSIADCKLSLIQLSAELISKLAKWKEDQSQSAKNSLMSSGVIFLSFLYENVSVGSLGIWSSIYI